MLEVTYGIQFIGWRCFLEVWGRLFAWEIKVFLQKVIFRWADGHRHGFARRCGLGRGRGRIDGAARKR